MGLVHSFALSLAAVFGAQAQGADADLFSMTEIAQSCGIDVRYTGPGGGGFVNIMIAGAAVEDFNRDGWMDIYILGGASAADRLFICTGPDKSGTIRYEDQGEAWGILGPQMGAGVSVADFDNNGYLDVFITAVGDHIITRPGQHRLYRNTGPDESGQFRFEEIAQQAGVHTTAINHGDGYSSSWGDIDADGDLDLMVGGWVARSGGNTLFRNNADGTFTDVTAEAIGIDLIETNGFTPKFVDVTGDGFPEILIAADYNSSKLLLNDGTGHFTDITESAGVNQDSNGMGAGAADVNNDGLIDWYVSSIMNEAVPAQDGNKLYINLGDGIFQETALEAGVDDGGWGWGVGMGDLDHDGDVDIVETNGWSGGTWVGEHSYIFLNDGDGTHFTESTAALGVTNNGLGRGTILFDHDNDGDLDAAFVSSNIRFALYRNDASEINTNHWIQIRLDTSASPSNTPDGIGAHVVIYAGGTVQHRWMQANSGYLSQGPIVIHAGLGEHTTVDRVEIHWSNGSLRVIENLAADTKHVLAACDGDFDHDRVVTMDDLDLFIKAFLARDRAADLDANAKHNLQDIFGFIRSYNDGCPSDS